MILGVQETSLEQELGIPIQQPNLLKFLWREAFQRRPN